MACTRPFQMYRTGDGSVSFKRQKGNWRQDNNSGESVDIPCGHCIGCRIQYTREWTGRCAAETLMRKYGHFVTLTYRDDNRPVSLQPDDLTKFLDNLRYHAGQFRYYAVGEYGEKSGGAHFHLCYWPKEQIQFGEMVSKDLYNSPTIVKAWPHGFVSVSHRLETASMAYVVGYVRKKLGSTQYITEDGEILTPPFARMSLGRKPNQGIGIEYILKHQNEIATNGALIIDKKKYPVSKDVIKKMTEQNQNKIELNQYKKRKGGQTNKNLEDIELNLKAQKRNTKL